MFVLEERYGNDGYAFWFKLLEMLGSSEGHTINLNDDMEVEFLASKTRIQRDICGDILDLLAKLGAIDAELWACKIIWSDNFVERMSDVYRKRKAEIPIKPDIRHQKPPSSGIPDAGNPQSKVKESKVKESKGSKSADQECPPFPILFSPPAYIPPDIWAAYLDVRAKKKAAKTDNALRLVVEELENIQKQNGDNPLEVLKKSIRSGWTDVYPLKNSGGNGNGYTEAAGGKRPQSDGEPYPCDLKA